MGIKSLSLVESLEAAQRNISRYQGEVQREPRLRERAAYTRAWYAARDETGAWRFAPSKFVGYRYATAEDYLADAGASGDRDGRRTEQVLAQWYSVADPDTSFGRAICEKLREFLAELGQRPNTRARLNVPKAELYAVAISAASSTRNSDLLKRISVDPGICGGRPCIRGTRMRVADLLAMMADGSSRSEILADFDYLRSDDLSAALAYAAQLTDHRIIQAG